MNWTSLVMLLGSTLALFFAAIVAGNAPQNSPQEQLARVVHQVAMVGMLVAFIGLLLASRLASITAFFAEQARENPAADKPKLRIWTRELRFLFTASGLLLLWVWGVAWIGKPTLFQVTDWMLIILAGLLANMVMVHPGCIRSFAIGTLVTMALVKVSGSSFVLMFLQHAAARPSGLAKQMIMYGGGFEVTTALLSGLLCAIHYNLVARARDAEPSAVTSV